MKFNQYLNEAVSRKEVMKWIKDPEALGYIQGNEPNWTHQKITDKLALKLQDEGVLVYHSKDDIFIWSGWINPKTGDYNSKFDKTFGK